MGHYHRIVNLTQRTQIVPMDVGVLDKLLEFGLCSGSAMAALWLLLAREAWCGDRIAILGYEGRHNDLSPEVITETGLDGTAFYDDRLTSSEELARSVLEESGICRFTTWTGESGLLHWRGEHDTDVSARGVDVVAVNLDKQQLVDPVCFGDSRDIVLAAAHGGMGGVTTALALLLAASNKGGGRGGGDFRSRHPLVGSWAGDRIGVLPVAMTAALSDISHEVRDVLQEAREPFWREPPPPLRPDTR